MRRAFFLLFFVIAAPLRAAPIEAGVQHVLAIPTGESAGLEIVDSRGFGAHLDVFWTGRVSTRFGAVLVNPAAFLDGVDMGTLGLDIYSATGRYHFAAQRRLSAFAGAGAAFVEIGNLDDRFGDEVVIEFDPELTFVVEAGLRYRIHPRIALEAGVAYVPLDLDVPRRMAVDPLIVSAGAAWRF